MVELEGAMLFRPARPEAVDMTPPVAYVFRIDAAGVSSFPYVSWACEQTYGFSAEQAMADVRLMHDAIHPADRARFERGAQESLHTMREMVWQGRILRTDGRERSVAIASTPQASPDGTIDWHGVVTNHHGPHRGDNPGEADRAPRDTVGALGDAIGAPLAVIVGYADWGLEVLQRSETRADAATIDMILHRCFHVIARQANRIDQVRNNLLVTAAANAGLLRTATEHVAVARHLADAAELRVRDLEVSIDCPEHLSCRVQPSHLDHMLANLVSNAERHAASRIWITAIASDTRVRISVTDDGPGVAPELVNRLFTEFAHAGTTTPESAGTGLGLHIVRTLVLANGGTVVYEPGRRRTRFTITLPSP